MRKSFRIAAFLFVIVLASLLGCSPAATSKPVTLTSSPAPSTSIVKPTMTATATATITATPTPHPAQVFADPFLAIAENSPPHFTDDFSNGNQGWTWDSRQQTQVQIIDGVLRVEGAGGHGIFPPHNMLQSQNFIFEFDVRLLNANTTIGTFFRQMRFDNFYSFTVYGDNSWQLFVAQTSQLPAMGNDHLRSLGETNHILIIARENQIAVYLNDMPVAYLEDETILDAGNLMPTFSGENNNIAKGEFDNFKFWNLDKLSNP